MRGLSGRLLIATPIIGDPNFDRTVVLVLEHGAEGALGLVLNRPTDVEVVEPLPEWVQLAAAPPVVFVGGPVEQGAAIGLARVTDGVDDDTHADGFNAVVGTIGMLDLSRRPEDLPLPVEQVRVFAGYAGWSPGQLEAELASDAWIVLDAEPDDVMGDDPGELWRTVLRRQGGDLALLASYPSDPSTN